MYRECLPRKAAREKGEPEEETLGEAYEESLSFCSVSLCVLESDEQGRIGDNLTMGYRLGA